MQIFDCASTFNYSYSITIECTAADENINRLNENGFIIEIFSDAVKSCDKFSNLKSSNYLSYIMTAKFARENKLNDALILNQYNRICEASIANIFWIKNQTVFTPPLSEGCVSGVLRKYFLMKLPDAGIMVQEKIILQDELKNADEIFLTNAVYGMRWIKQFGSSFYSLNLGNHIYQSILIPLWK